MKLKLPIKKKKKEEQPQKPFEEFAIDPSVLEELDNLPEETQKVIFPSESEQQEEVVEILNNEEEIVDEFPVVDAASTEFITIVRDNIDFCTNEIKDISQTMDKIETQKNSESFWKKGENIRTISKYVNKMSDIQQKTLDLLIMFLGASGKMAEDYDTILQTIDELGELNGGEIEVLDYLLKVKRMIKEIKNNDERLKNIIFENEHLKNKVSELEKNYKEKTDSFEKNSKILVSKINRVHGRLNRQSFALFFSYILIIAMGVIIYLKLFKGA